jgi:hypothetical protein
MNPKSCLKTMLLLALGALAPLALPAAATAKDRNHDRIPDRWEKRHHLSLAVKQTHRDQDRDSLRNRAEFLAGDNPRDADSDDDGVMDGEENAGTIQSFDPETGRLVIALFGEETVSGLVTEATKIKCEDEHSPDIARASHDGEEAGDDHGDHEEAGDDHGDESGEVGEDHGDNSGPGSHNSGPSSHDDEGTGANCTTADLIEGAVVQEAGLELEHGVATFDEVELAD